MGVEVARTGERRFRLHFLQSRELIGWLPRCRVVAEWCLQSVG